MTEIPLSDDALLGALSEDQKEQLNGYIDELLGANAKFNLTAVRKRDEAWSRHVVESLRLTQLIAAPTSPECPKNLLDVGTGGGVPGMILAIARPDIQVTLLEATNKKARFLEETARRLGAENVTVLCERAERAGSPGQPTREAFDMVSARAVAALPTLLELTLPFAKKGGLFMAVKGEKAMQELEEAKNAMSQLGAEFESSVRHPSATVLMIRKQKRTSNKYPRRPGEPKHKPL